MPLTTACTEYGEMGSVSLTAASVASQNEATARRFGNSNNAMHFVLSQLTCGTSVYKLRKRVAADYYRSLKELHVEQLSPTFVGHGDTQLSSLSDLEIQIHKRTQELLALRPFEMNPVDNRHFKILSRVLDLAAYQRTTPLTIRQLGKVLHEGSDFPQSIRWETGHKERIGLDQVHSPDFVTFKDGQPVEAMVVRDAETRKLLYISSILRTAPLRTPREIESSGFPNRIRSSNDLPDA